MSQLVVRQMRRLVDESERYDEARRAALELMGPVTSSSGGSRGHGKTSTTGDTCRASGFVDTNVLVYAFDESAGAQRIEANRVLTDLWSAATGVLSTQVLREFYNVVTHKFKVSGSAG